MSDSVAGPPPTVRFAPRRLAHVNLYVGDLAASASFYRDVCGVRQVFDEAEIEAVFLSNGSSHHDLALIRAGTPVIAAQGRGLVPGLNHLGFEMESEADLVAGARRVGAAGGTIVRQSNHTISRSIYLLDPDAMGVEVYADDAEDWRVTYSRIEGRYMTSDWDPFAVKTPSESANYEVAPAVDSVDEAPVHPVRLARAALRVSDLALSISWYEGVLGLDLLAGGPDSGGAVMGGRLGRPDVMLLPCGDRPTGLDHLSLELASPDDVEATAHRLAARDVPLLRTTASGEALGIVVTDPDRVLVELFAVTDGVGLPDVDDWRGQS